MFTAPSGAEFHDGLRLKKSACVWFEPAINWVSPKPFCCCNRQCNCFLLAFSWQLGPCRALQSPLSGLFEEVMRLEELSLTFDYFTLCFFVS